ncbi:hypothetical protein [Nocardia brasiliensis]|nr:hypothetical protein [Nocardia brasiliensis]
MTTLLGLAEVMMHLPNFKALKDQSVPVFSATTISNSLPVTAS